MTHTLRKQLGFWVFLLTGRVVLGFDPEQDGMEGIKRLVRKWFPEVAQLRTAELADWLADPNRPQPRILDVRKPEEFALSHLARARRVDPNAKGSSLKSLVAMDQPVVVYCSVGYRSSQMARRLMESGIKNVSNLEGSIFQWANEGRALVDSKGPATKVHPYSNRWAGLLKSEVRGGTD